MTDRPIIFSAPMIRALVEGRKTQTRRLGSSRLAAGIRVGDRLWVREAVFARQVGSSSRLSAYAADDADVLDVNGLRLPPWWNHGAGRPSIHMPRWASRLTLTVTEVRREKLQEITEEDAIAEGVACPTCNGRGWYLERFADNHGTPCAACIDQARNAGYPVSSDEFVRPNNRRHFELLWNRIHGQDSWDSNPEVIVLSFTIEHRNIDAQEARAA